jgi:HD-GYP domain-containing protein (c-di-GMP phosphodiesterase class II)
MLDRVGGLVADQIPVESAVVSCCDAFNAMTTDRSYRAAMTLDEAMDELRSNAGTQFSPEVVDALVGILNADPLVVGARGPRVAAVA